MKRMMLLAALAMAGCSDARNAERVLADQGYTNVHDTGWAMFGCGGDDTFKTKFTATAPGGGEVHGVVCKGLLKGSTVRVQ